MCQKRKKQQEEMTLGDWMVEVRKKKFKKRLEETNKTWEECHQLLKERRSQYAHLNFFSKFDEEQHTNSLYRGYRIKHFSLLGNRYTPQPGARLDYRCRFTFDNLEDEYHIQLAKFAIEDYNREENVQLAFKDLLYYDSLSNRLGDKHLLLVAASNLSNHEIKCYRTVVLACNGEERVLHFAHYRIKILRALLWRRNKHSALLWLKDGKNTQTQQVLEGCSVYWLTGMCTTPLALHTFI